MCVDRKLSSVQRQLNVYGFRSISRGEHKRSFYHPLFKRGNWEVVKQMARYVPTKGGHQGMDVDPLSIESALPAEEREETSRATGFYATPAGRQAAPLVTSAGCGGNNALRVCLDDDFAPDYFASDFHLISDVGHESTSVTVQPVDYSIPIDFNLSTNSSGHFASVSCDEDGQQGNLRPESKNCDWAFHDDASMNWADMFLECETANANLNMATTSMDWGVSMPLPEKIRRNSSARLFSTLTPPLEGERTVEEGCHHLSKASMRLPAQAAEGDWWVGSEVTVAEDWANAAMATRYRTDSMNDLYALCAELA